MNSYQEEQMAAFQLVREHLPELKAMIQQTMAADLKAYVAFRQETDEFLDKYFADTCSASCYRSQLSACCTKDGIITFFADWVVNIFFSDEPALDQMATRLQKTHSGTKCLYLSSEGCLWTIKPVVCQMFLCDRAQNEVFSCHPEAAARWNALTEKKKAFTWPDKPVLFDTLESIFIAAGHRSPLMYLHNSPGLLRIKKQAGLKN